MHTKTHPEYVEGCFACKVGTLQFGVVPGAYRDTNSTSYVDHESIVQSGVPTLEEVNDRRTDLYRSAGEQGVEEFDIGTNPSRGLTQWAEGSGS
jgi:hypothetical protein